MQIQGSMGADYKSAPAMYLRKVGNMGYEKAHESAAKTIRDVREIIGFKRF